VLIAVGETKNIKGLLGIFRESIQPSNGLMRYRTIPSRGFDRLTMRLESTDPES
jgi:hypothetical protein